MFDSKKLLDELMGAGSAPRSATPAAPGAQPPAPASAPGGDVGTDAASRARGFASAIGSVLKQATTGLQDAARDVETRTGIGGKANDALKQATGGQGAGELLSRARQLATENKLATGAAIGGLAAILLGTGAGRGVATTAAKLGGLAMIGGLAYKAMQNYQAGKPILDLGGGVEPAPAASPFGETANPRQDADTALLLVRAMIAAASADGIVDNAERNHIVGGLERAGLDVAAARFLDEEFAHPASIESLVAGATSPEIAAEVYVAARLAIDPDHPAERAFLARLADGLRLQSEFVAHADAAARGVTPKA